MSNKIECPGCKAYSSSVLHAFDQGDPCPFCGLPESAARAVLLVQEQRANEAVTKMAEAALLRAGRAERKAAQYDELIDALREVLDRFSGVRGE